MRLKMPKKIFLLFFFILWGGASTLYGRAPFEEAVERHLVETLPYTLKELSSLPVAIEVRNEVADFLSSPARVKGFFKNLYFILEQKEEGEEAPDISPEISPSSPLSLKHLIGGSQDVLKAFPQVVKNKLKSSLQHIKENLRKIKILNQGGWKNNVKNASLEIKKDFVDLGATVRGMYQSGKSRDLGGHTYVIGVMRSLEDLGKAQADFGHLLGNMTHLRLAKKLIVHHVDQVVRGERLFFLDPVRDLWKGSQEIKNKEYKKGLIDLAKTVVHSATGVGILGQELMNFIGTGLSFTPAGSLPPLIITQIFSLMSQTDTLLNAGALSVENASEAIKVLLNHESPKIAFLKFVESGSCAFAVVTIIGANVLPIVIPIALPGIQQGLGELGTALVTHLLVEFSNFLCYLEEKKYAVES